MHKIFENCPLLNSYHEHNFNQTLEIGVSKQMGAISKEIAKKELKKKYINTLSPIKSNKFIDFSNALPWVSEELISINESTKPIFLSRNGIKVVSSFFNKFKEIMYPESKFEETINWWNNKFDKALKPPTDKVYWRPIIPEMLDSENLEAGRRFKMICYYWKICSEKSLKIINKQQNSFLFKFEDLLVNKIKRQEFCDIVGVGADFLENKFQKPINVAEPVSYKLDESQKKVFSAICSKTMETLKYKEVDYEVKY